MDPYARIAAFYEAEYGRLEADAAFFSRRAQGGSLLVLGCGTGRICSLLASEQQVTGLDLSQGMIDFGLRAHPGLRLLQGDMRSFDLGRFDEIIAPNGAFSFLSTRADQQRCLSACRRALGARGALTIDLPMPTFGLWSVAYSPEETAWEGQINGEEARRTRETHRYLFRQRLELLDRYYLGGTQVARSALVLRVALPGEIEWMLEASGFYVEEIVGDYSGGPLREGSPRIVARAMVL